MAMKKLARVFKSVKTPAALGDEKTVFPPNYNPPEQHEAVAASFSSKPKQSCTAPGTPQTCSPKRRDEENSESFSFRPSTPPGSSTLMTPVTRLDNVDEDDSDEDFDENDLLNDLMSAAGSLSTALSIAKSSPSKTSLVESSKSHTVMNLNPTSSGLRKSPLSVQTSACGTVGVHTTEAASASPSLNLTNEITPTCASTTSQRSGTSASDFNTSRDGSIEGWRTTWSATPSTSCTSGRSSISQGSSVVAPSTPSQPSCYFVERPPFVSMCSSPSGSGHGSSRPNSTSGSGSSWVGIGSTRPKSLLSSNNSASSRVSSPCGSTADSPASPVGSDSSNSAVGQPTPRLSSVSEVPGYMREIQPVVSKSVGSSPVSSRPGSPFHSGSGTMPRPLNSARSQWSMLQRSRSPGP